VRGEEQSIKGILEAEGHVEEAYDDGAGVSVEIVAMFALKDVISLFWGGGQKPPRQKQIRSKYLHVAFHVKIYLRRKLIPAS
jgi:hypothetical protein